MISQAIQVWERTQGVLQIIISVLLWNTLTSDWRKNSGQRKSTLRKLLKIWSALSYLLDRGERYHQNKTKEVHARMPASWEEHGHSENICVQLYVGQMLLSGTVCAGERGFSSSYPIHHYLSTSANTSHTSNFLYANSVRLLNQIILSVINRAGFYKSR